jgi:uncharacterized membrane protein YccF (DUF307 family)
VRAPGAGVASAVGNVLWFVIAGWWLAVLHVVSGIAFCVTVDGAGQVVAGSSAQRARKSFSSAVIRRGRAMSKS